MDVLGWPSVTSGTCVYLLVQLRRDWRARAASNLARWKQTCESGCSLQKSMTYSDVQFQHRVQEQFY